MGDSACGEREYVDREGTHINFLMTRWNFEPLYPKPNSFPSLSIPVANARKFSTVLGVVYAPKKIRRDVSAVSFPRLQPNCPEREMRTDLAVETNDD